jgi:hypothetical protein
VILYYSPICIKNFKKNNMQLPSIQISGVGVAIDDDEASAKTEFA